MPRCLLYPKSFVRSITIPERWDRRPLPNLFHKAPQPSRDAEVARLERWYRELQSGEKTELKRRLRSLSLRDFWSAYYELMTARIGLQLGALSVRHGPLLDGKRPDLLLAFASGARQIWEVAAAFQAPGREGDDDKAHALASFLSREFQHRWSIIMGAKQFGPGGLSLRVARPRIQHWLNRLELWRTANSSASTTCNQL